MSDTLATQLVTAAAEAIRDVDVDRGMIGASDEEMAQAAVVATLRALAARGYSFAVRLPALHPDAISSLKRFHDPAVLANRIEQGDSK